MKKAPLLYNKIEGLLHGLSGKVGEHKPDFLLLKTKC